MIGAATPAPRHWIRLRIVAPTRSPGDAMGCSVGFPGYRCPSKRSSATAGETPPPATCTARVCHSYCFAERTEIGSLVTVLEETTSKPLAVPVSTTKVQPPEPQ